MNDMSESDQSDLDRKAIAEEPARSMQRVESSASRVRESRVEMGPEKSQSRSRRSDRLSPIDMRHCRDR